MPVLQWIEMKTREAVDAHHHPPAAGHLVCMKARPIDAAVNPREARYQRAVCGCDPDRGARRRRDHRDHHGQHRDRNHPTRPGPAARTTRDPNRRGLLRRSPTQSPHVSHRGPIQTARTGASVGPRPHKCTASISDPATGSAGGPTAEQDGVIKGRRGKRLGTVAGAAAVGQCEGLPATARTPTALRTPAARAGSRAFRHAKRATRPLARVTSAKATSSGLHPTSLDTGQRRHGQPR